jgi:SAM-dependent methyltransferase
MAGTDIIQANSGIMVNAGCGLSPTPGWLNFDNSLSVRVAGLPIVSAALGKIGLLPSKSAELAELARAGEVRFANAAARIPCAPGSVAAVYSSHMIEHLDRAEARAFLTEVLRVLQPGGVVRIVAPDLFKLVNNYLTTEDADELVAGLHMSLDRPAGFRGRARWALVGPRHHLWMYDGESLSRLLRAAGFEDPAVMPPGLTRIAGPGKLDLAERESESVYVEAFRPR